MSEQEKFEDLLKDMKGIDGSEMFPKLDEKTPDAPKKYFPKSTK